MEKLFFIRIGGTAMGGVAAALQSMGFQISGSEPELYEPMKSYLAEHGVEVFTSFSPSHLTSSAPDRVVVGNAVSRGNEELEFALGHKMSLVSLPALIGEKLIDKNTSIVIAGTHGKTTTTSMAAWLLESAGKQPGYLIGGVPGNFENSCRPVPSSLHNTTAGFFVIEGDEYDTAYFDKRSKCLLYRPDLAVLHNIEFDHADIFDSIEDIKKTFRLFVRLVPRNGVALVNGDDPIVAEVMRDPVTPVETFGLGENCDWRASDITNSGSWSGFTLTHKGEALGLVEFPMPGEHNVRNMLAACAVASHCGLSFSEIQEGAKTYIPPKRRMEELGDWRGAKVVDDFAHHPTAIKATIQALQAKYPGRKIWVAFEPRSNTTTRNLFQKELGECFAGASGVAFGATDRPWRYSDSERLNLDQLISELGGQNIQGMYVSTDQAKDAQWGTVVRDWLLPRVSEGDVVAVLSNGNFGGLRQLLK